MDTKELSAITKADHLAYTRALFGDDWVFVYYKAGVSYWRADKGGGRMTVGNVFVRIWKNKAAAENVERATPTPQTKKGAGSE